jgi:hypothetical protein
MDGVRGEAPVWLATGGAGHDYQELLVTPGSSPA